MSTPIVIAICWVVVVAWVGGTLFANKDSHPEGLFYLFFAEMWERFSFYGMRGLLTLYMTKELLYADEKAFGVYGAYGALVYATPVLGGLLADRLLGYRRAIMLGAVLMALGHFLMAVENSYAFYSALALLIVGNGFFKPNISSLVGKLYPEGDARRDQGFTLFYQGINVGAFLAGITCGWLGEEVGWHWGFGLAGVGMLLGLVVFWRAASNNVFEDHGLPPKGVGLDEGWLGPVTKSHVVWIASFLSIPLFAGLVNQNQFMSYLLTGLGVALLAGLLITTVPQGKVVRERMFVVLAMTGMSTLFWAFFEQAGTSINLFTDRHVDRTIMGMEIATSQFQSLNPGYIILLAPFFAWLWKKLDSAGLEPSAPFKFALALAQLGLGFYALTMGIATAGENQTVALGWLALGYFLHTTGEMCMSPIGLSLVTKLSPPKIVGLVMGTWFLSSSFAHHLGGIIAIFTSADPGGTGGMETYAMVFAQIGHVAMGAAVLAAVISPVLRWWMHGVK